MLVAAVVVGDGVWQFPVLELERVDISAESAAEEQEPKRVLDEEVWKEGRSIKRQG